MGVSYLLLHTPRFDPSAIAAALEAERVRVTATASASDVAVGSCPTVLVLAAADRDGLPRETLVTFVECGGAIVALGHGGEQDVPLALEACGISAFLLHPVGRRHMLLALRSAFREAAERAEARRAGAEAASRTREVRELTRIGIALAAERDLNALLEMILTHARRVTQSDAGSLYLVEREDDRPVRLRFVLAQGDSRPDIPFVEHTIPIDHKSIAGYVASTGDPLVIDDAYSLPPNAEYAINRSFDERYRYRTKSMLTIPMIDHKDEMIGVVQLINRKRDPAAMLDRREDFDQQVVPYSNRTLELVSALAAQAGVAIENSQLYQDIERLFDGFVRAAVTAIEQRDPTTFGHSGRVADTTVRLALAVGRAGAGALRDVAFTRDEIREIRYAGLLHDFGKVGVREQVLVKAKKLYEPQLHLLHQRYGFVRRTLERDFYRRRMEYLERSGTSGYQDFLAEAETAFRHEMGQLDRFLAVVLRANEPTVLPEGSFEELHRYHELRYLDVDDQERPLLTHEELRCLSIRKGSLDEAERLEIESHVNHTYRFLLQIPWTSELRDIPRIAFGHHEKLDGSGYPLRVQGADNIPIQTRMMTLADIFDALTAQDRPYKPSLPAPRALDILAAEVKAGQLDPDLFEVFVAARVYQPAEA